MTKYLANSCDGIDKTEERTYR